jgi:hypothetical protein
MVHIITASCLQVLRRILSSVVHLASSHLPSGVLFNHQPITRNPKYFTSLWLLKEKFSWIKIGGIASCIAGIIFVAISDDGASAGAPAQSVIGDALTLFSAIMCAPPPPPLPSIACECIDGPLFSVSFDSLTPLQVWGVHNPHQASSTK